MQGADLVAGPGEFAGHLAVKPPPSDTLTMIRAGNGSGTVTSKPAGMSCSHTCSHSFPIGTSVRLTARPAAGSAFTGWSRNCSGTKTCIVTMTGPRTVAAKFSLVPSITSFSLTNTRFAVASNPTAISAGNRTPHRGTTFRYTLSVASTATIRIERQSTGRLVGKKCVAQTKRNAAHKRCTLYAKTGSLTRKAHKGKNTLAFSGRIGHKALKPASYRVTITARIGTGPTSKKRTATFTIVRS